MTNYVIRRIIVAVPLLLLVSLSVFVLMNLIPGGPLSAYENNPDITAQDLERLRHELGLDAPLHVRYWNWLAAVLHGDWGISQITRRPALTEIGEKLPNTLYLSLIAFALTLLISIPIGVISAIRQYSWFDHLSTTIAFMGQSMPVFWFGLILIIIFNVMLKHPGGGPLLPGTGMYTVGAPVTFEDRITHLILPVTVLVLFGLGSQVRFMRAGMLDVLTQDYIRTAHAKGLRERSVILRHAFKNSAIPLVTLIGLELPGLVNGALITETIFAWPGMGRLFFNSIERADYAVMMGVLMLSATIIILGGLLTDILYGFLDPRIRFD